jgi:hypothetical protein
MEARPMSRPLSIALAAIALAMVPGCDGPPPGEDPSLVTGRVWLETRPQSPTDYVHGLFLLPRPYVGAFQRSSSYDFHFERFDYKREGKTLSLTFPQTGKKADVTFTISPCDTLPPFDLCLDLNDNPWGGPKRFYGKRRQVDDDAMLKEMRAHLPEP